MKKKNYLSEIAQKIDPYTWEFGDGNEVRFNSNTVPCQPKSLQLFLEDMFKTCPINEYADPNYSDLKQLLANYENISAENITITNSGDEAIDIVAKTFLNPNDFFIITPPTYEMFSIQSGINRGIPLEIPLSKDTWKIDAEKIITATKNPKAKLIFLCNPNNPTGSIIPQKDIKKIVKQANAIVVVDETYREFFGETSVPLLEKYKNLVILRSFSKFAGMAGARIGYLLANKFLTQKFNGIRFPMGVSFFSYKLAERVLKNDREWIKKQIEIIKRERSRLTEALKSFGFFVYPSEANFLLVKIGNKVTDIYQKLKEKGIFIRDRSDKKNLEGCVRITIRSPKENTMLIYAIEEIYKKNKYAFIDRDGTLIFEPQDTFQIDSIEKLKILEGVVKGLKELKRQGYELIIISNQDGLGTSSFPLADFEAPQNKMLSVFEENGITFNKIFICPHLPSKNCGCRKPKTGLVKKFLKDNQIDKNNSFVCGDRPADKLFAKNIGVKFIPIQTNGDFYNALGQRGVIT